MDKNNISYRKLRKIGHQKHMYSLGYKKQPKRLQQLLKLTWCREDSIRHI